MPLFTRENAAILGHKGAVARWSRPPTPAPLAPSPAIKPGTVPPFVSERLARVRLQLNRLDALAVKETDSKKLKEFAEAAKSLQIQEMQLDNRPLPGSLRPRAASGPARVDISRLGDDLPEQSEQQQGEQPGSEPSI